MSRRPIIAGNWKMHNNKAQAKELIEKNMLRESYIDQIKNIANLLKEHRLNIDYYPTNFVVKEDKLYYIDYECNEYHDEWSFDTWGIKYWK